MDFWPFNTDGWKNFWANVRNAIGIGGGDATDPAVTDAGNGVVTNPVEASPNVATETVTTQQIVHLDNGLITDYLDVQLNNDSTSGVIRDMLWRMKHDWKEGDFTGFPDPATYSSSYSNGSWSQSWGNTISMRPDQLDALAVAVIPLMYQGETVSVGQLRDALLNAQVLDANGNPTGPAIVEDTLHGLSREDIADKMIEYEIKRWNSIWGQHQLPTIDSDGQVISLKTQMAYAGVGPYDPIAQYDPNTGILMANTGIDKTITTTVVAGAPNADTQSLPNDPNAFENFASSIYPHPFKMPDINAFGGLAELAKAIGSSGTHGLFEATMLAADASFSSNPLQQTNYKTLDGNIDSIFFTNVDLAQGGLDKTIAWLLGPDSENLIKRSIAENAMMVLDDALYPYRADNFATSPKSNEARMQAIIEGIELARDTGNKAFVRDCIYFLHNNGCDLQIENGQLKVITLPGSSTTASLGQDHTVAYHVPGLEDVHGSVPSTTYGTQPQPSGQFVG